MVTKRMIGSHIILLCAGLASVAAYEDVCVDAHYDVDVTNTRLNPLRGFFPFGYDDTSAINSPLEHSMVFGIFAISDVVQGEGVYDWSALEHLLNRAQAHEKQAVVRFYYDNPTFPTGVPDYLLEGDDPVTLTEYEEYGGGLSPDYENPRLIAATTDFIREFGAQYDGDIRLAYIQIGILGKWGEWHTYPSVQLFPGRYVQWEVLTAFDDSFSITQLVVGNAEMLYWEIGTVNATTDLRIGWHDDVFGDTTYTDSGAMLDWWFYKKLESHDALERHDQVPIGGEIRPSFQPTIFTSEWDGEPFVPAADAVKATWLLHNRGFTVEISEDELERTREASDHLGYQFFVESFKATLKDVGSCPKPMDGEDVCVTIESVVKNAGNSPFYYDLTLETTFRGEVVETLDNMQFDLGEGGEISFSDTFVWKPTSETESATFGHRFVSDHIMIPIRFANTGSGDDGFEVVIASSCLVDKSPPDLEVEYFAKRESIWMSLSSSERLSKAYCGVGDRPSLEDAITTGTLVELDEEDKKYETEIFGLEPGTRYEYWCWVGDRAENYDDTWALFYTKGSRECDLRCEDPYVPDSRCRECECANFWEGEECDVCTLECGENGEPDKNCAECSCSGQWDGDECNKCDLGCVHGEHSKGCSVCHCDGIWAHTYCDFCPLQCPPNHKQSSDCTECICAGQWGGDDCNTCLLECENGARNTACTRCECDSNWGGRECDECGLTCEHGVPDSSCENCICEDQWVGNQCDVCVPDCSGKVCGSDGCGGECFDTLSESLCMDPFICSTDGDSCVCELECLNGGVLDASTCSCSCPEFFQGENCGSPVDCEPICLNQNEEHVCDVSDGCGSTCVCSGFDSLCLMQTCVVPPSGSLNGPLSDFGDEYVSELISYQDDLRFHFEVEDENQLHHMLENGGAIFFSIYEDGELVFAYEVHRDVHHLVAPATQLRSDQEFEVRAIAGSKGMEPHTIAGNPSAMASAVFKTAPEPEFTFQISPSAGTELETVFTLTLLPGEVKSSSDFISTVTFGYVNEMVEDSHEVPLAESSSLHIKTPIPRGSDEGSTVVCRVVMASGLTFVLTDFVNLETAKILEYFDDATIQNFLLVESALQSSSQTVPTETVLRLVSSSTEQRDASLIAHASLTFDLASDFSDVCTFSALVEDVARSIVASASDPDVQADVAKSLWGLLATIVREMSKCRTESIELFLAVDNLEEQLHEVTFSVLERFDAGVVLEKKSRTMNVVGVMIDEPVALWLDGYELAQDQSLDLLNGLNVVFENFAIADLQGEFPLGGKDGAVKVVIETFSDGALFSQEGSLSIISTVLDARVETTGEMELQGELQYHSRLTLADNVSRRSLMEIPVWAEQAMCTLLTTSSEGNVVYKDCGAPTILEESGGVEDDALGFHCICNNMGKTAVHIPSSVAQHVFMSVETASSPSELSTEKIGIIGAAGGVVLILLIAFILRRRIPSKPADSRYDSFDDIGAEKKQVKSRRTKHKKAPLRRPSRQGLIADATQSDAFTTDFSEVEVPRLSVDAEDEIWSGAEAELQFDASPMYAHKARLGDTLSPQTPQDDIKQHTVTPSKSPRRPSLEAFLSFFSRADARKESMPSVGEGHVSNERKQNRRESETDWTTDWTTDAYKTSEMSGNEFPRSASASSRSCFEGNSPAMYSAAESGYLSSAANSAFTTPADTPNVRVGSGHLRQRTGASPLSRRVLTEAPMTNLALGEAKNPMQVSFAPETV